MREQSETLKINNDSKVSATAGRYPLSLSADRVPGGRTAPAPGLHANARHAEGWAAPAAAHTLPIPLLPAGTRLSPYGAKRFLLLPELTNDRPPGEPHE